MGTLVLALAAIAVTLAVLWWLEAREHRRFVEWVKRGQEGD